MPEDGLALKKRLRRRASSSIKPHLSPQGLPAASDSGRSGQEGLVEKPSEAPEALASEAEATALGGEATLGPGRWWAALWLGAWLGGLLAPAPSAAWPPPLGWAPWGPHALEGLVPALILVGVAAGLWGLARLGAAGPPGRALTALGWPKWAPAGASWALLFGLMAVLFAPYAAWRNPREGAQDFAALSPRRWLRVEVVVLGPPQPSPEGGWQALGQVQACSRFPLHQGRLSLRWPANSPRPGEGHRYALAGALRRPSACWNPLGPRPGAHLAREGAFAQLWVEESQALGPEAGLRWAWGRGVDGLRVALAKGMGQGLRPDQAGLLAGLALGDAASAVPQEATEAFRAVGLSHLVAASGAQVGLMAAIAWGLARALGLGFTACGWASALSVLGYLALTGGPPSMVRAAFMGLVAVVAWARAESPAPGAALAIAGLLALLWCPAWASDLGYALSVVATYGLMRLARFGVPEGWPAWLWAALAVPVACWAWTLPLQLWAFGSASAMALLANWLATPIGLLAAPWGLALGLLGWLWPPAAALLNRPAGWALDAFLGLAQALAAVPGQQFWVAAWPLAALLLAYAALALGWRRWRWALACLGLLLGLLACHRPGGPGAMAWVLDVGQGLSVVLRSPQGRFALIDGGPPGAGERALLPFLRRLGCRKLDLVVASHAHADHLGGLVEVAAALPIGQVWEAGQPSEEEDQGLFLAALLRQACPFSTPGKGKAWRLGPWRVSSLGAGPGPETNEGSLGVRLEAYGQRILVPGDGEAKAEAHWLRHPKALKAEVLVLGHHGSRTSTSPPFLAAVAPRLAIASAGRHNGFGHPHPSTVAKLEAAGIPLARTDEQGGIALSLSPQGLSCGDGPNRWQDSRQVAP